MASAILPPELIFEILERLYYTAEGKPDNISLINCSLVSCAWSAPAQQLLFRAPVLLTGARARAFEFATAGHRSKGPALAAHVRVLNVDVDIPSSALSPRLFAQLVIRCVRLYELKISAPTIHLLGRDTLAILADIPPIRALSILKTGVQSPLLYQLISLIPSVKHLRLSSELHAPPPTEPPKFRLYELDILRAPPPKVMAWLLGASGTSLRILELWDMCNRATMRTLMQTHGHQLRSLRLLHFNHQATEIIRECPNLEEVVLWHVPTVVALGDLPQSIEHLAFRDPLHSHAFTLVPIVNAIKGLPKLRLVTCDENATRHVDFPLLRATCADAGVVLKSNALPFTVSEDMIPVSRFPRRKSISNFKLMN